MRSFFIALQFLTRIQLKRQTQWTNEDFGRSVLCFPLVGVLIGGVLCIVYAGGTFFFSNDYAAVLVIGAWFLVTGGLHADGFMDTADGIFSGRSRERMLEILKDSRVGANGVMAFFFLAVLKISFLANIPSAIVPAALIAIPAAARFGTLISIFEFPYARKEGLGRAFIQYAPPYTLAAAFVLALIPVAYGGFFCLILLGAAMMISLCANRYITCVLGGVTGDTYGAVLELSEMLLLGLTAVLFH